MENVDQYLDNAIHELSEIYTELKIESKVARNKEFVSSPQHKPVHEETRDLTDQVDDDKNSQSEVEIKNQNNLKNDFYYDEVPSNLEKNQMQNNNNESKKCKNHGYSVPNSRPATELIYKSPTKFFVSSDQSTIKRKNIKNNEIHFEVQNSTPSHSFRSSSKEKRQIFSSARKNFSEDGSSTRSFSIQSQSDYDEVPPIIPKYREENESFPDYEEISDSLSDIHDTATLPHTHNTKPHTSIQTNTSYATVKKAKQSGNDTTNGVVPVEVINTHQSSNDFVAIDQTKEEVFFVRYPILQHINDRSDEPAGNGVGYYSKRASGISMSTCGPPEIDTPTGSIIDTTKSIYYQNTQISSRTLNTPYEIFMVVSIVFVIALIILAVIGYLYVGFSINGG